MTWNNTAKKIHTPVVGITLFDAETFTDIEINELEEPVDLMLKVKDQFKGKKVKTMQNYYLSYKNAA